MFTSSHDTLGKEERVYGRKLIEKLFNGGKSHSMAAYPLRLVYMLMDVGSEATSAQAPKARMMVSVSKRHFKRAVKRNRVKRQVREAYRHNKDIILKRLNEPTGKAVIMAFIWLDDNPRDSCDVSKSVVSLLERLSEKL